MTSKPQFDRLSDIVENGLCMGCGLCQAIAGCDHIATTITPDGRQRPREIKSVPADDWQTILKTCPGIYVGAPDPEVGNGQVVDPVWGPLRNVSLGYAADPDVRFRAAGGGVLTALASYLAQSDEVDFVMQVRADPARPMRTKTVFSRSVDDVIRASGSRYGPSTPLDSVKAALDTGERFAFIGKPCDVTGLRSYAREDPRVAAQCIYMLALVCGGGPEFRKSRDLVQDLGYHEDDVTVMRYRGYGNPGRARVETRDGNAVELTYAELWDDQSKWCSQTRCRICPDGIGESADIVSGDFWPGCQPTKEDAGFNSIMVRTERGKRLYASAVTAGFLTIDRQLEVADMSNTQPHQVTKKREMWARYVGLAAAGHPAPVAESGLRLKELAEGQTLTENLRAARGARLRVHRGRFNENEVTPDTAA